MRQAFFSSFPRDNLGLVIQSKITQYLDMAKKQTNTEYNQFEQHIASVESTAHIGNEAGVSIL